MRKTLLLLPVLVLLAAGCTKATTNTPQTNSALTNQNSSSQYQLKPNTVDAALSGFNPDEEESVFDNQEAVELRDVSEINNGAIGDLENAQ